MVNALTNANLGHRNMFEGRPQNLARQQVQPSPQAILSAQPSPVRHAPLIEPEVNNEDVDELEAQIENMLREDALERSETRMQVQSAERRVANPARVARDMNENELL